MQNHNHHTLTINISVLYEKKKIRPDIKRQGPPHEEQPL